MNGSFWNRNNRRLLNVFRFVYNFVGIRGKVMGIAVALLLLLGVWLTWEVQVSHTGTLREQLEKRGVSIARDVAARSTDYIFTNNIYSLYELTRETLRNNEDVRYVMIIDSSGQILVHTFGQGIPRGLREANSVAPEELFRIQTLKTEEGLVHDVAVPIFQGRAGTVRVGMSEKSLGLTVGNLTKQLWMTTLAVILLGLLAAWGLAVLITNPIRELAGITEEVAQGNLAHRFDPWLKDEIGRLGKSFNTMVDNLERSRKELELKEEMRIQLLNKVITAQEEERKRIARELHDQTGQMLTTLALRLKMLADAKDARVATAIADDLRNLLNQVQDYIRGIALELRPSVLDDLGLEAALQRYTRECTRKWGIEVDFHSSGFEGYRPLPHEETAVYRVVQEALTNVAKHSRAANVSVILERQQDALVAIVEDDGVGFNVDEVMGSPVEEKKLGLFGMQERVNLIGGTLTIESEPGSGSTIYIKVPQTREVAYA